MQSQKKIKGWSKVTKEPTFAKQKGRFIFSKHQTQSVHLRSLSKETTPQKNTQPFYEPKKQFDHISKNKTNQKHIVSLCSKSKHMTSIGSYSAIDKETLPNTKRKRKYSFIKSGEKKRSLNQSHGKIKKKNPEKQLSQQLKMTNKNFHVLAKCLNEFVKQERKEGKNPTKQILNFIKAFNKSEISNVSKDLQILIASILDCIQNNVQKNQERVIKTQCCEQSDEQNDNISISKSPSQYSLGNHNKYVQKNDERLPETIKKQINDRSLSNSQQSEYKEKITTIKKNDKDIEQQLAEDVSEISRQLDELRKVNNRLIEEAAHRNNAKKNLQAQLEEQHKIMRFLNLKQKGEHRDVGNVSKSQSQDSN